MTTLPPPPPGNHGARYLRRRQRHRRQQRSGVDHENFVVTRAAGSGNGAFDVSYKTSDGTRHGLLTATTTLQSNTLHFAAGVSSQTISVIINGKYKVEQTRPTAFYLLSRRDQRHDPHAGVQHLSSTMTTRPAPARSGDASMPKATPGRLIQGLR